MNGCFTIQAKIIGVRVNEDGTGDVEFLPSQPSMGTGEIENETIKAMVRAPRLKEVAAAVGCGVGQLQFEGSYTRSEGGGIKLTFGLIGGFKSEIQARLSEVVRGQGDDKPYRAERVFSQYLQGLGGGKSGGYFGPSQCSSAISHGIESGV